MTWTLSPERARVHASTRPIDARYPAHWCRCMYINELDQRCIKPEGHSDDHEPPKERKT